MRGSYTCALTLLLTLVACSGRKRPFADAPFEGLTGSSPAAGAPAMEPNTAAMGSGAEQDPGATGGEAIGGVPVDTLLPQDDAAQNSANLLCEADAAACAVRDAGSIPPACVPTGPRDCTSDLDNDCDGQFDNVLDDVCACLPGTAEPCQEHPGLDGQGQCRAGLRTCLLDEVALTSA
jgi:hypothetical protein